MTLAEIHPNRERLSLTSPIVYDMNKPVKTSFFCLSIWHDWTRDSPSLPIHVEVVQKFILIMHDSASISRIWELGFWPIFWFWAIFGVPKLENEQKSAKNGIFAISAPKNGPKSKNWPKFQVTFGAPMKWNNLAKNWVPNTIWGKKN